jgi:hypothetical protein
LPGFRSPEPRTIASSGTSRQESCSESGIVGAWHCASGAGRQHAGVPGSAHATSSDATHSKAHARNTHSMIAGSVTARSLEVWTREERMRKELYPKPSRPLNDPFRTHTIGWMSASASAAGREYAGSSTREHDPSRPAAHSSAEDGSAARQAVRDVFHSRRNLPTRPEPSHARSRSSTSRTRGRGRGRCRATRRRRAPRERSSRTSPR